MVLACAVSYAEDISIGITGEVVEEIDGGAWRNVRLRLTYAYTFTQEFVDFQESHPYQYVRLYRDHIVYQSLEDTLDTGVALTQQSVSELNPDDIPGMGRRTYHEEILTCERTINTPRGFCDTAEVKITNAGELDLTFALPQCGNWRVWYVVDTKPWSMFCGTSTDPDSGVFATRTFMLEATGYSAWCAGIDTNLVAYSRDSALVARFVDIDMGDCAPIPPVAGDVKTEFQDYLNSNGGFGEEGRKWLPTPGDSIGLVFKFLTTPAEQPFDVAYHIWDMTMWKGECMNSPRFDDSTKLGKKDKLPATTGFSGQVPRDSLEEKFPFWDFTVAEQQEYGFYVWDTLRSVSTAPGNLWLLPGDTLLLQPQEFYPLPEDRKRFQTEIVAYKRINQKYDTLWLKSLDYGAHCLVTVEAGSGKDRKMEKWHPDSAYVEDSLWTLTVPFDYDGYYDVGVNYGDCMADAWESEVARQWQDTAWVNTDIRYFRPFVTPFLGTADFDIVPRGREIDGDYLCNFAEYRGLMIADDSTDTSDGHSHRRLDPRQKSVIVHVRNDMDADPGNRSVLELMPGYIYKMLVDTVVFADTVRADTIEILFTDSIRFLPVKYRFDDQRAIERVRLAQGDTLIFGRDINFNRAGAGLWYYGLGYPSTYPMSSLDTVRASTFWSWDRLIETGELLRHQQNPDSVLAATWPSHYVFQDNGRSATIPNETVRIVFNLDAFEGAHSQYVSDSLWQVDYPLQMTRAIAHEFGHSVGMMHPYNTIPRSIMTPGRFNLISHRFVFVHTDSTYSDSCKAEISVKGE